MKKAVLTISLLLVCAFVFCSCGSGDMTGIKDTQLPLETLAQNTHAAGSKVDDLKKLFMDDGKFAALFLPIAEECFSISEGYEGRGRDPQFIYLFDERAFFSEFTYEGKPIPSSGIPVGESTAELIEELRAICPSLDISILAPISDAPGMYYVRFMTIFPSPIDAGAYDSEEIVYFPHDAETDFFKYHERLRDNWYYDYIMLP